MKRLALPHAWRSRFWDRVLAGLFIAAATLVAAVAWQRPARDPKLAFFSPEIYPEELARHTWLGMINNVYTPEKLRRSLETARQQGARLQLDFSPIFLRKHQDIHTTYQSNGQLQQKSFSPLPSHKVKRPNTYSELKRLIAPTAPILKKYRRQIAAIFIADEPYLHGISRSELERAARSVRHLLAENGLHDVPLGVTFAGAMFHPGFAAMIAGQANAYVADIEQYYQNIRGDESEESRRWIEAYSQNRLTTYDLAGNIYTGGGIPEGVDIIAYDLYTASLLQDTLHAHTLAWFAELGASAACTPFKNTSMPQVRTQLSFYSDDNAGAAPGAQEADNALLNAIFTCKSESMLQLLKKHAPKGTTLQLWGESSANGFLDFDARGNKKNEQSQALIAARVRSEMQRTLDFYQRRRRDYAGGLIFFIWDDTVDITINLPISGARSVPGAPAMVFEKIGKRRPH